MDLPAPFGPKQSEDRPVGNFEGGAFDGREFAEAFCQPIGFNDRHYGWWVSGPSPMGGRKT